MASRVGLARFHRFFMDWLISRISQVGRGDVSSYMIPGSRMILACAWKLQSVRALTREVAGGMIISNSKRRNDWPLNEGLKID